VPAGETIPLASYEFQFHTDGPNSGAPASISEAVSNVGRISADTITDNDATHSGDVITFDLQNHGYVDADTLNITIGGTTLANPLTVSGTPSGEDLASQLQAHLITELTATPIPGISTDDITVAGTTITIRGLNTVEGASLVQDTPVPADNLISDGTADINGQPETNNPSTLQPDTISINLEGKAAVWEDDDNMTVTINGYAFTLTTPDLDTSSDLALATSVRDAIVAEAGNIPGVDAAGITAGTLTSPKIEITGIVDDAQGSGLAGRNEYAVSVTRDTRQNTAFVDEDGFTVNPTETGDPIIARLGIDLPGGGTQNVDIDLGAINTLDGVTQFAGEYAPTLIERDGAQFGSLDRVEIDDGGVMNAIFNNGQVRPIYRLPVIDFVNPNGLLAVDGNAFQATAQAGAFYMWDAGSGPAGSISGSSLEASTVDIAEEFSNMIVAQRAYSSNAKIIQTADQMLQEVTNLKR
ncbi:MAG: flagellar hook-basal body complex protein, partial [Alphaproteobacteria bacterium]|jgi:flagellar hook-basal body protein|nr:flagellar hook-basal body complex protein [Alphaproteobacteria bacterium]